MERNIALKIMYNGSAYHGWQVQKNAVTVAETLEKALSTIVCHPVKCTGAGRTDAGVHAETYIANFRTTSTIPLDKLPLAVNTRLPNERCIDGYIAATASHQIPVAGAGTTGVYLNISAHGAHYTPHVPVWQASFPGMSKFRRCLGTK